MHVLITRAVGFAPDTFRAEVFDEESVSRDVILKASVTTLGEVRVRDSAPVAAKLMAFDERRRANAGGTFIDSTVIAKWEYRKAGDLLSTVSGVDVQRQRQCGVPDRKSRHSVDEDRSKRATRAVLHGRVPRRCTSRAREHDVRHQQHRAHPRRRDRGVFEHGPDSGAVQPDVGRVWCCSSLDEVELPDADGANRANERESVLDEILARDCDRACVSRSRVGSRRSPEASAAWWSTRLGNQCRELRSSLVRRVARQKLDGMVAFA